MVTFSEFQGFRGELLLKDPDSIRGAPFKIFDLENCEVYLMDRSRTLTVRDVWNSRLFLGPASESCFVQNCHDCTISVACQQFTAKDLHSCTLFIFCCTRPVLENCTNIRLAPYNYAYPHQDQHFLASKLDSSKDFGRQPVCYDQTTIWAPLAENKYYEEKKELLGFTPAVNPVLLESSISTLPNEEDTFVIRPIVKPNSNDSSPGDFLDVSIESGSDRANVSQIELASSSWRIDYRHPEGFVSKKAWPKQVAKHVKDLSEEAKTAYDSLNTLFFTAHLIFVGALLLILLAVILKSIEDWHAGAWGMCLTVLVTSSIACGGLVLWKYMQTHKIAEASLSSHAKAGKLEGFEIECSLLAVTLTRLIN